MLLLLDLLVILLAAAWLSGFRVNVTTSLPKGLYRLSPGNVERGDLVTFCLEPGNPFSALAEERGYLGPGSCANGLRPLLKRLAGLPGDRVDIEPQGLRLNGNHLPGTARPRRDRQGRSLPASLLRADLIPEGFALVLSQEHDGSFDGRHFGLIPMASLIKVRPVAVTGRN